VIIEITTVETLTPPFNIKSFIEKALHAKHITTGHFEFNFISKEAIVELNKTHLNRDYVTDILSFNLGTPEDIIGDVYICPDKAAENAKDLNHSLEFELKTLIIHGILHLLDYSDYTPEEKETMFTEQNRLLTELTHEK